MARLTCASEPNRVSADGIHFAVAEVRYTANISHSDSCEPPLPPTCGGGGDEGEPEYFIAGGSIGTRSDILLLDPNDAETLTEVRGRPTTGSLRIDSRPVRTLQAAGTTPTLSCGGGDWTCWVETWEICISLDGGATWDFFDYIDVNVCEYLAE